MQQSSPPNQDNQSSTMMTKSSVQTHFTTNSAAQSIPISSIPSHSQNIASNSSSVEPSSSTSHILSPTTSNFVQFSKNMTGGGAGGVPFHSTIASQQKDFKKPQFSSHQSEDIQTHHAHIDDEHIMEVSPSGRYGKLNIILGKGAYKVVWKALDLEDGIEVAWNAFQTTKQESTELSQEIEILKKVRHPNIISFRDSWFSNGEFVFITELMTSGTLREYIQKLRKPQIKVVKRWSRQILKGLLYLHGHHPPIIHRDIKCDNLFINGAHGEIKIGDMGTAKMKFGKKYTVIGTPEFMAPEMYEEKGYSEKVDVYAFGMCLLEMVTGEYPYSECKNAAQIYKKVSSGIRPECLNRVEDEEVLSLIQVCISSEHERPSVRQVLEHPFFLSDPEVILLSVDELRGVLNMQVVFRGLDRLSVKFEFNIDSDTSEDVVNEMIEEKVLNERYQSLVTTDINNILRDVERSYTFESIGAIDSSTFVASAPTGPVDIPTHVTTVPFELQPPPVTGDTELPWKRDIQYKSELLRVQREVEMAQKKTEEAEERAKEMEKKAFQEEKRKQELNALIEMLKYELVLKEQDINTVETLNHSLSPVPSNVSLEMSGNPILSHSPPIITGSLPHAITNDSNEQPSSQSANVPLYTETAVDDLIIEIAYSTNRPEKAAEWIAKLRSQDIKTIGDLCDLHEEDWPSLNLTVFAFRALRNAIVTRSIIKGTSKGSKALIGGGSSVSSMIATGGSSGSAVGSSMALPNAVSKGMIQEDHGIIKDVSGYRINAASEGASSSIGSIVDEHPTVTACSFVNDVVMNGEYEDTHYNLDNEAIEYAHPSPKSRLQISPVRNHEQIYSIDPVDLSTKNTVSRSMSASPILSKKTSRHNEYADTTNYE